MNEQMTEIRRLIYYTGAMVVILSIVMVLGTVFHIFNSEPQPGASPQHVQAAPRPSKAPDPALYVLDCVILAVGGSMMIYGRPGLSSPRVPTDLQQTPQTSNSVTGSIDSMFSDIVEDFSSEDETSGHNDKPPATVIKVRCLQCQALNEENAKFCSECGKPMV